MSLPPIGKKAPAFTGKNQDGKTISINDFKGKKLVLYFYPKDDTPGCTAQACNLAENHKALLDMGYAVLGVSPDDEKKHARFIAKYNLPFDLIADTDHSIAEAFGVWVEKSMYGKKYMGIARTTFLISPEGKIEDIIEKVDTKNHTEQILP
ncbi:MAG: thioredoxin-dependent thiol peroxidase [Bacteroidota bacterium]